MVIASILVQVVSLGRDSLVSQPLLASCKLGEAALDLGKDLVVESWH